jgi:hypothetical protein
MAGGRNEATTISLALLCAAETRNFFTMNLPPVSEIQHSQKVYDAHSIREGEVTGALFSLGLGAVVAIVAEDPLPLLMTGLVAAGMLATYEHAIRRPTKPATDG